MVSDDMWQCNHDIFSGVGQTALDENGFKVMRESEHKSYNCKMSNARRWSSLFLSGVEHEKFEFAAPKQWKSEVVPPGYKQPDMSNLYQPVLKMCTSELGNIVSEKQSPPWHSPAPARECVVDADLAFARECEKLGHWPNFADLYQGRLLHGGSRMLVRNLKVHGDQWYFPLCDPGHPAKLSWPAAEMGSIDGFKYFALKAEADADMCPFLHVHNVGQWEAIEYAWEPAIARVARHGCDKMSFAGACALQASKPEGLLTFAAKRAFFSLSKAALLQLARDFKVELDNGDTLVQVLSKMITHWLGYRSCGVVGRLSNLDLY